MMVSIVKDVGLQRVLFFGDSTMRKLWKPAHQHIHRHINNVSDKNIPSTRCDWLQQSEPSKVWKKLNLTREGPLLFGLEHQWCTCL